MSSAYPSAAKSSALSATPSASALTTTKRATWKNLLPREHGSWALTFEPVVLGLLAGFSIAGLWLSLAATAEAIVRVTPTR